MRKLCMLIMAIALVGLTFISCDKKDKPGSGKADLIVYGTIYTVDDSAPQAKAFAVKDGKFVYVGDEGGVKAYKGSKTVVLDYRGKGMVAPAFTDGHAHYLMSNGMTVMGSLHFDMFDEPDYVLGEVKKEYAKARKEGKSAIYGFGWEYHIFKDDMPTLKELDEACPDIPLYLSDGEGHKGLANTACMIKAGILDEEGNVLITDIRGGEIVFDELGYPTGLLKEQAGTFCRLNGIDFLKLMDAEQARKAVTITRDALHSKGYVSYIEGWANYYGNLRFYEAAKALDIKNELNLCLGMAYEVESSKTGKDRQDEFDRAYATDKGFATRHINPRYIKLFVDGTVETHTGFVSEAYIDEEGGYGEANWTEDEFQKITFDVNDHNFTVHAHAMGDKAVNLAVTAFASKGRKNMRNTLVHVRNVLDSDYSVMAANNIVATSGVLWHIINDMTRDVLRKSLPEIYVNQFYPIKSYFDKGVVMSTHSDFPALSGSSELPLYMMEICVTGILPVKGTEAFWTEELITRQQALKALTLNGAYQMHNEKERGSIQVGKYADFVLIDRDVMDERSCPAKDIHTGNVTRTYFEGKMVFTK